MSKIKTLYLPEGAMYPFDTEEEEAQRFLIEKELRKQGREELKVQDNRLLVSALHWLHKSKF